jgi:predicted O-methyltransferase YrrM
MPRFPGRGGPASRPIVAHRFPQGHYHSPVADLREVRDEARHAQLWPAQPRETPGLAWRDEAQVALCRDVFAHQERLDLAPVATGDPSTYFAANGQYPPLDAWILEAMLRHLRPRRMIEVGSGFSSLITARVNREFLDGALDFTCIEPFPRDFLAGVPGIDLLVEQKVQDVDLDLYAGLGNGDVLFIDTSHTIKTGGDVPWIFHEILPRLADGVVVHVHDIFLPREYPELWVSDGWGWSEQYLVHSFLLFNDVFELTFGARWMIEHHQDLLHSAFPGYAGYELEGASGLWIRRSGGSAR